MGNLFGHLLEVEAPIVLRLGKHRPTKLFRKARKPPPAHSLLA
jgi:hypothetical protein